MKLQGRIVDSGEKLVPEISSFEYFPSQIKNLPEHRDSVSAISLKNIKQEG